MADVVSPSPRAQLNSTQSLIFPPASLGALASRLAGRYASRILQPKSQVVEEDEYQSEQEQDSYESETSTESELNASVYSPRRLYQVQRVVLTDLPIEIIEHIAASLRDPIPVLDAAGRFIDEKYSDFSEARFPLSTFSKVSSSVRRTVERILYRDVQLDCTGWKGRKHPKWPAGCLRLLLRTLEDRPELGRYISSAAVDYQLSTEPSALEQGLGDFLARTPHLKTLFLSHCPLALWNFPLHNARTFATSFANGILPSVLEHFPKLQNLYLRDCVYMGFDSEVPEHKLRTVRFDSNHAHAAVQFARALNACSDTTDHLDIRFIGGLLQPSPVFGSKLPKLSDNFGSALRSLRLDNISIFSSLTSAFAKMLLKLPVLEDLHVSNHTCFSPDAFSILPPSIQTLTVSDYHGYWEVTSEDIEKNTFLSAMAQCIAIPSRKISSVVASNGTGKMIGLDLEPVSAACKLEGIKFSEIIVRDHFVQLIFEV